MSPAIALAREARTPTPWGPSLEAFQHVYRLDALRRFERLTRMGSVSFIPAVGIFMGGVYVDERRLARHHTARGAEFNELRAWAEDVDREPRQDVFWNSLLDSERRFQSVVGYLEATGREVACRNDRLDAVRLDRIEARAVLRGAIIPRLAAPFCAFGTIEALDDPEACVVLRAIASAPTFYVVTAYSQATDAPGGVIYKTPSATGFIPLLADQIETYADRGTVLVSLQDSYLATTRPDAAEAVSSDARVIRIDRIAASA